MAGEPVVHVVVKVGSKSIEVPCTLVRDAWGEGFVVEYDALVRAIEDEAGRELEGVRDVSE